MRTVDLPASMRREADQKLATDSCADSDGRRVRLADVHAVGARRECHRRQVVDDAQRSQLVADAGHDPRRRNELVALEVFVAKLYEIDATCDRGAQERLECGTGRPRVTDQVQVRGGQPRAAKAGEIRCRHRVKCAMSGAPEDRDLRTADRARLARAKELDHACDFQRADPA
jgi:hypothetical protein